VEERRARLERLLQITAHAYDMNLAFGKRDGVGQDQVVLGLSPEAAATADYGSLKGRALHLLGHYLSDVRGAAERAESKENAGALRFVRLWHALEDARLENRMVDRWPGMSKAFDAKLPPKLGGSFLQRMSAHQQLEMGLYLDGRDLRGARLGPAIRAALDDSSDAIRRGASGAAPADSLEALEAIHPRLAPLLSGARGHKGKGDQETLGAEAGGRAPGTRAGGANPASDTPPEIQLEDGLVAVRPLGRERQLPEWYRPGSAPWFERGLGEKRIHPSALRSDRETIISPPRGDVGTYRDLWIEVQREAGFLLSRFVRLLQEETYLRYAGRYRSGLLESNRLWKQRLGNYRLFQRRERGGKRELAVSLLVDESASMQGREKSKTAAKAAILLGETLSRLHVPLEIIGYTTAGFEARQAMLLGLTPAHAYRTMRCSPLEHRIYKSFDEPYRFVRTRLTEIRPRHNNWDEEHLAFAFRRLQSRPERTKLVLVISDGQPNGDADELIRSVAALERQGCKIIGLGIGEDFVRTIYRKAIVVADFRQMGEALLGLLSLELTGGPAAIRSRTTAATPGAPLRW
jgi:hypothetical protein